MNDSKANPQRAAQIQQRLEALGVQESDLEESFVRSGGHGGQNVNKTATCVMLVHRPTGLLVKCQETRHQGRNRLLARELLIEKLEARKRQEAAAVLAQREKIRRQNRRRSQRAKQRMLADKSHQAVKKSNRRRVRSDD